MKRILMLQPHTCGSGDTRVNKIYNIKEEILGVWNESNSENDFYPYTKEKIEKYPNGHRWITIKDETSEDSFEVKQNEDRFIIFEDNKQLAHELINRIEGLDETIVNMALMFEK